MLNVVRRMVLWTTLTVVTPVMGYVVVYATYDRSGCADSGSSDCDGPSIGAAGFAIMTFYALVFLFIGNEVRLSVTRMRRRD